MIEIILFVTLKICTKKHKKNIALLQCYLNVINYIYSIKLIVPYNFAKTKNTWPLIQS